MNTLVSAVAGGLLLAVAGHAGAVAGFDLTPAGGPQRISTSTADEVDVAVAWSRTGNEYLVVWQDHRNESTRGTEIFGRLVDRNGVPIGKDFRISSSGAYEYSPQVAWNGTANEYLVVWMDMRRQATRGSEIYGHRVGADGALIGTDFGISASTDDETHPSVVWNSTANQYLVVWEDFRHVSDRPDVFGRRVRADGSLIGTTDFRINSTDADGVSDPQVAWNATKNQYLVVWDAFAFGPGSSTREGSDIVGRRLGANGWPIGPDFLINSFVDNEQVEPALAWNAAKNQYLVVWHDTRNQGVRGFEIYGRLVGWGGTPMGSDLLISSSTFDELYPKVMWNTVANEYVVVWQDGRSVGSRGWDIYGRGVGAAGGVLGVDILVSGLSAIKDDWSPAVAWNPTANNYLVVWQDKRNFATRGWEIYSRRLTP